MDRWGPPTCIDSIGNLAAGHIMHADLWQFCSCRSISSMVVLQLLVQSTADSRCSRQRLGGLRG